MKNRIMAIFLAFFLVLALLPVTARAADAASGVCGADGGNVRWSLDGGGTLTISGTGAMCDYPDSSSPWKDAGITRAVIEDGVTAIGENAFCDCVSLSSVTISDTVTQIKYGAFFNCVSLTDVYYSNTKLQWSVESIDETDNRNDPLINAAIHYADSTVQCGPHLTWEMDEGVVTIGGTGRMWNWDTGTIHLSGVWPTPWCTYRDSIAQVIVKDGVSTIGHDAFLACENLTSVTIADSVDSIGRGAFYFCTGLTSFTIPKGVAAIGDMAFFQCSGLREFIVDSENPNYSTIDGVLYDKSGTTLIQYPAGNPASAYVIPDGVTGIGNYAFAGCENLTGITIPDSVTTIGSFPFYECSNLTGITIPKNVTTIGDFAFAEFDNSDSLTIPDSVASIGKYAFYHCSSLNGDIVIPNGVTSIEDNTFFGCNGLTGVVIPDSVTSIKYRAFGFCGLTSVTIPDSVTSIGREAFSSCSSLTSITIPNSVTSIGNEAFAVCDSLTSVTIPGSVASIGAGAFYECDGLTSAVILNGVTTIGNGMFRDCDQLSSVTIPVSVTSIERYAFSRCNSLTDVYYGGTEAQWNSININNDQSSHNPLLNAAIHYNSAGAERPPVSHTITFTVNGETFTLPAAEGTAITLPVCTIAAPEGKEFKAWLINGVEYAAGASYTFTGNATVTAVWQNTVSAPEHVHVWGTAWASDETHHWKECSTSECPIKENSSKYEYGAHTYDKENETVCSTCEYQRAVNPPVEEAETNYILISDITNGDIIPTVRYASQGEFVTLTVHPSPGYDLDKLSVKDLRGRELTLRESGGNRYSFIMPDTRVTVSAQFTKVPAADTEPDADAPAADAFTGLGTPGISGIVLNPAAMPFTDVRAGNWYYDSVEYVWKHYLMSGVSETQFAPDTTTSRAMIWTVLARMKNIRTEVNPGSTWYERGMLWAMEQGITDGSNPMGDITREQLAAMLWRSAGSPGATTDLSRFSDSAEISNYAKSAVNWAVSNGILNGSDGKLTPQGTATRAQVAAMVMRYGERIGA